MLRGITDLARTDNTKVNLNHALHLIPYACNHRFLSVRVYWRAPDDKISARNDTRSTSLRIDGLRAGVEYECAVKSGNHYGSSQLTTPVLIVPGRIFVSSESTDESE